MEIKGCVLVVILVINCVALALCAAVPENELEDNSNYNQVDSTMKIKWLEQKLREDIAREENDLMALEAQLHTNLDMIHTKKRQLEIKKRQPVQCLVNIVSCWK